MSLLSEFHRQFLKTISSHGVKFIVVGGHAAIFYGVRRGTGDLDILIEPSSENGRKLLKAFETLRLEVDEVKPTEFEGTLFLSLGFEPDAVDILTITPGIDFASAYQNSTVIKNKDLNLNIISLEDLIKNKESLDRGEEKKKLDEYDVAVLKRILKNRTKRD